MRGPDYKALAREVAGAHTREGGSVTYVVDGPEDQEGLVLVQIPGALQQIHGPTIHPRDVRAFCWAQRRVRRMGRERTVLWTLYNREEDLSLIGLGVMISEKTLPRLGGRFEWTRLGAEV